MFVILAKDFGSRLSPDDVPPIPQRGVKDLTGHEQSLMAAMKKVEGELSDDLHSKVTTLLVELSGYNVMKLLHELQSERARMALGKA